MNARDLMIGDCVKIDTHLCGDEIRYDKVIELGEYIDCGIPVLFIRTNTHRGIKSIEPIPLTHEILEKNGFRYDEEDGWVFADKDYGLLILCVLEGCFVQIESKGLVAELHIQYVHELQHALRLCGFNSLADNLKI